MAVSMSPKQKVYQGVLKEIRQFIDHHHLVPGDKIPSERELSEIVSASRSSIREALRAMELLGLIETRHGGGTYLSAYRPYQTVELLSSFILQEDNTKEDLVVTKKILEKEAAKLAFPYVTETEIQTLSSYIQATDLDANEKHVAFFQYLFAKTDNLLLAKVWQLMEEFSHTINKVYYDEGFYQALIQLYVQKKDEQIEDLFNNVTYKLSV